MLSTLLIQTMLSKNADNSNLNHALYVQWGHMSHFRETQCCQMKSSIKCLAETGDSTSACFLESNVIVTESNVV